MVGLERIAERASPLAKQFADEIYRQIRLGTTWSIVFHIIRNLVRMGKLTETVEYDSNGRVTDLIVAIPAPVRAAQETIFSDGVPSPFERAFALPADKEAAAVATPPDSELKSLRPETEALRPPGVLWVPRPLEVGSLLGDAPSRRLGEPFGEFPLTFPDYRHKPARPT